MLNLLNHVRISTRIMLLILLTVFGSAALLYASSLSLRETLYQQHENESKHLVQAAHGLLVHFAAGAQLGKIGLEEAKQMARKHISDLNYGETGYFWINDINGLMLSHPIENLNDVNVLETRDARGKYLFKEMIEIARKDGAGFMTYYWPPTNPQLKKSYIMSFPEWGWIIGSGIFIDDVEDQINATYFKMLYKGSGLLAVVLFLAFVIGRSITLPLHSIAKTLQKVAAGDHNAKVNIDMKRSDEIGEMAKTVTIFVKHAKRVAYIDKEKAHLEKTKDEIISIVSHELRTPLTSIRGSLGLILGAMKKEIPEKPLHLINMAYQNCDRLMVLINDLLDIDKTASGEMTVKMQMEQLHPILEQAVESNKAYADKHHVRYIYEPISPEVQLNIDRARLLQILANLLSNAAKFSPAGGAVLLKASENVDHIKISIVDHGLGVPREFRDKIFAKFSQADSSTTRKKGGTGLGLNISKSLTELMSGQIGFDSQDGFGTTFWVTFPLSEEKRIRSHK